MEQQLINGGVIVVFAWLVISKVFDYLKSKGKGNGSTEILQKIAGNDLLHINEGISEQNTILKHHTELLVKIATILELKLK